MIDESSKVRVRKELLSVFLSYAIQGAALENLIRLAEHEDITEIIHTKKEEKWQNEEQGFVENFDSETLETIEKIIQAYKLASKEVLKNSLLVQAVSLWENFLREFLRILLFYNWEVLKSKEKKFTKTYEDLLDTISDYNEIEDFRLELINDYLYKLFYNTIDQIADELNRIGLFNLRDFEKWNDLRAAYYTRNIVTHNNNKISKEYCRKIGLAESEVGMEIEISPTYLKEVSRTVEEFIEFINESTLEKYNLPEIL